MAAGEQSEKWAVLPSMRQPPALAGEGAPALCPPHSSTTWRDWVPACFF